MKWYDVKEFLRLLQGQFFQGSAAVCSWG